MRIGFVGFGEVNSPIDLITESCDKARAEIAALGYSLVTSPIVRDDVDGQDVQRAISDLSEVPFDLLVVCLTGWIPSHAVIAITSQFADKPMILWGLAGYYENQRLVTAAAQAGTTALRKVFADLGYKFKYIYNIVGKPSPIAKIKDFVKASFALKELQSAKVGMFGFRDMRLYNTLYDGISLKRKLGMEVEFFELLEMITGAERVEEKELAVVLTKIQSDWVFQTAIETAFLEQGVRYYLAIKELANRHGISAISIKDVDGMKSLLKYPPAFVFMLLADEAGLCTIPENDVMGAVTQLIVKKLTGQCAAYFEFYEFFENSVLMGVPDYVPAEVVDGKVTVTQAAFGGISGGLLNISKVRPGEMTLLRVSQTGDQLWMHMVRGTASPINWMEAGWDEPAPLLPSFELKLEHSVEEFAEQISGQHYIAVYGDYTAILKEFCYLAGVNVV